MTSSANNSSSDIEPRVSTESPNVHDNLSGYTVTVPSGWSQQNLPSSTSDFYVTGVVSLYSMYDLYVETEFDMISCFEHDQEYNVEFFFDGVLVAKGYSSFTLTITGGTDITNYSLIRWLEINNATFEKTVTDLTGYTVTVPAGWTATAEYGRFEVVGECNGSSFTVFGVGFQAFRGSLVALENSVGLQTSMANFSNNSVLNISFSSSVDVTNASLIQWLYDNNATFTPTSEPNEVYIDSGVYVFDDRLTMVPASPFSSSFAFESNGISFDTIEYDSSNLLVYSSSTNVSVAFDEGFWRSGGYRIITVTERTAVNQACYDFIHNYTNYYAVGTFDEIYQYIFSLGESQGYDEGYLSGYDEGYLVGEQHGYDVGYSEGRNSAQSEQFIDGFFGDFFGGIREALDSLVLYQSTNTPIPIVVTVWNALSTIIMLFIVIFVLKLVAGG